MHDPKIFSVFQNQVAWLKIVDPGTTLYLWDQLNSLGDIGGRIKGVRLGESPSRLVRQLDNVVRTPSRMLDELIRDERSSAESFIDHDTVAPLVLYQYASQRWGRLAEKHLHQGGDVLTALATEPEPEEAIRNAAEAARRLMQEHTEKGKGGRRHKRDEALSMAAKHVLEIYQTITGRLPGVSIQSNVESQEEQIRGKTVEFLYDCLGLMGFHTSRPTLRRLIETFRKREKVVCHNRR